MMELGAVSDPLDEGFARRRNGEPFPNTWDCPNTSSTVHGQRSRHIVGHIRRPEQIILSHAYTLQHGIEHRFDTGQTTPSRFTPAPAGGGRRRQSLVTA